MQYDIFPLRNDYIQEPALNFHIGSCVKHASIKAKMARVRLCEAIVESFQFFRSLRLADAQGGN
jgi:hypothetical protein